MNKKTLTIIAAVVIGLLIICSVGIFILWKNYEGQLGKVEDLIDPTSVEVSTEPTAFVPVTEGLVGCDYLTEADAAEILSTTVKADIDDGSNTCTYFVDSDDQTDFRRIALMIMTTGNAESARNDFMNSKAFFEPTDIEDVTFENADEAFYSKDTNQLYVLRDNHYFIIVAIASEFDNHLDTAILAANKVLDRL